MNRTSKIVNLLQGLKIAGVQKLLKLFNNRPNIAEEYFAEIDEAIAIFNQDFQELPDYLINSHHTHKDFSNELKSLDFVINALSEDRDLLKEVIEEILNFNLIEEIKIEKILLGNVCILIYRTTMLNLFLEARMEAIQFSSTIEEILAWKIINGKQSKLYESIKHWIVQWEEEDFSEKLYLKLKSLNKL